MTPVHNRHMVLETRDLAIGYRHPGGKSLTLTARAALSIHQGEVVGLLGPNGSGKSTLLRTLSGLQMPLSGQVSIMGKPLKSNQPAHTARLISVVLTEPLVIRDLTVRQLVSMGRYPYLNWLGRLHARDEDLIDQSLRQTHVDAYENRHLFELSDGELQRVMIARALCQDTPIILLDEPTAHLDLPNRVSIMRLLRVLARQTGKSILFSSHELDLTLQTADTLWMLRSGEPILTGIPEDLVLNGAFESTFQADGVDFDKSTGNFRFHHEGSYPVYCTGNSVIGFWTHRALEREGYRVTEQPENNIRLEILSQSGTWKLFDGTGESHFNNLQTLITFLNGIRLNQPELFKKD